MGYFLRFSIICVILYIMCINMGVDAKHIKQNMLQIPLNSVYSNEPDENNWAWNKIQSNLMDFQSDLDSLNSEDYDEGEENLENDVQYSIENTQNIGSDGDDKEFESLLSVNKRNFRRQSPLELCPMHQKLYKLSGDWKSFSLRNNHTERICNHTITSDGYNRQLNKVCDSFVAGTHCFQRFTSKDIIVVDRSGKLHKYTEERFMDGCSCGWASDELGNIDEYHFGNKILKCKINRIG